MFKLVKRLVKKQTLAKVVDGLINKCLMDIKQNNYPESEIIKLKIDCIKEIIEFYKIYLDEAINKRTAEMIHDANEHYIVYKVLGIDEEEHSKIDHYQNKGRFVFKYAGALLEDLARLCIGGVPVSFENKISTSPKKFHIDCYVESTNLAHEIKWKDGTTDGDHTKKESNKIQGMINEGMTPVRVMFFMPEREQSKKIQEKVIAAYKANGYAYIGNDAFDYVKKCSGIDLKLIFNSL